MFTCGAFLLHTVPHSVKGSFAREGKMLWHFLPLLGRLLKYGGGSFVLYAAGSPCCYLLLLLSSGKCCNRTLGDQWYFSYETKRCCYLLLFLLLSEVCLQADLPCSVALNESLGSFRELFLET